jgi:hypothetical protein
MPVAPRPSPTESGSLDAIIVPPAPDPGVRTAQRAPERPAPESLDEILHQGQPAGRGQRQAPSHGTDQRQPPRSRKRQQVTRSGKRRQAAAPGTKRDVGPEPQEVRKRAVVASGARRLQQAPKKRPLGQLSFTVPQVGIAGVLGLATIAAPVTGLLSTPAKTVPNAATRTSMAGAPLFPALVHPENAVEDLRLIPEDSRSSIPLTLNAPGQMLVTRVTRDGERAVLPGCDGTVPITSMSNGNVPSANLCTLWDGEEKLRADAAVALAKMNVAYRKRFGHDMVIIDGYRTLSEQYAMKESRGGYAAAPGTSEHGWGIAVDFGDGASSRSSLAYQWLRANAADYGWYNPAWAQPGGSGPNEPWHWQYRPGEISLGIPEN